MADERCETCGADVSHMGSGGPTPPDPYVQHLTDFNDPHRTLDLVAKKYYGVTAPVVDPSTYRPGDWYFNLDNGNGYVFRATNDGFEWRLVISPTHVDIDLSAYLLKTEAAETYVTKAFASENYLRASDLANYVTSAAMSAVLASYATQQYVATAISSSGHMTMAEADLRYIRAASEGDQYVSHSELTAALGAYTPTSGIAAAIGLSAYLTTAAADAADGFVRKSYISQLDFVTPSQLAAALAPYATQTYVGNLGFLTRASADLVYLQIPPSPYVDAAYVANALSSYTPTSGLAAAIGLSAYLTTAAADASDGFVRKSAIPDLPFVTSSQLATALSPYATQSYVNGLGFLTRTAADLVYLPIPATPYVNAAYVANALSAYTPTSGLAAAIGLSNYLTLAYADGPDGFIRKSGAGSLNYVTETRLQQAIAGFVPASSLPSVKSEIRAAVVSEIAPVFATKAELAQVVLSQGANVLYRPPLEDGKYVLRDKADNQITLSGSTTSVDVLLPAAVPGTSRDFLLVFDFEYEGDDVWGQTAFDVVVHQRPGELPHRKLFAAEPGILHVDMSSYLASDALAILGFSEVGDCKFMITRKSVTNVEPTVTPNPAEDEPEEGGE